MLGRVESKAVSSELAFLWDAQADEPRQVYVQTRFAVGSTPADATGNFIGKGQPLFTIYSPDLVATEQEYLIAERMRRLQRSNVSGVALGAATLFSAAKREVSGMGYSL